MSDVQLAERLRFADVGRWADKVAARQMGALTSNRHKLGPAIINSFRAMLFGVLAAFILLGPAAPQILDVRSLLLRPWIMYSGVGVGILKGRFVLAGPGIERQEMTPLELLGLEAYPPQRHYEFDRRVLEAADLKRFASEACQALPEGAVLSFRGSVGTRSGWKVLNAEDICAPEAGTEPAGSLPPRRNGANFHA